MKYIENVLERNGGRDSKHSWRSRDMISTMRFH